MKIVADKNIPFLEGVAEQYGDVVYLSGSEFNNYTIRDADVLIVRTVSRMDEAMLSGSNVKLICTATIGYDHIDTAYCDSNQIVWKNAPGCNSGSVMQYILSSLIVLARRHRFSLRDRTIGVVGAGMVGAKVAQACNALGMKVLINDPPREDLGEMGNFVSLKELKKDADIITFHTPLIKTGKYKTYHLADSDFFNSLGKKSYLLNSSRGGVVDTQAAKIALKNGLVAGFLVDCWEDEPDIDSEYLAMAEIATPHIAGYSADGKANASRMSLMSIADFFGMSKDAVSLINEPAPKSPMIDLSKFGTGDRIHDAILQTYNPMEDFDRLKYQPQMFKQLRNEYPLRREFNAYQLINASADELELWRLLQSIGKGS